MVKNTDLHTHSHYSDGQISPRDLVRLAKEREIKNLALTDHTSVKGVKEAIGEGKKIGVNVIPAIEITCRWGEVLGYFIDIENKELIEEMKKSSKRIENQIRDWCKKLNKAGYKVSFSEIKKKYPKARDNINGSYPLIELHLKGHGKTRDIAKELREKGIKGKRIEEMSIIEAIKLIKRAKGVPVLAHPWLDDEVLKEKNFKKYVKAGLRGIELNNGDRFPFKKKGSDKKIKNLVKKYNLIMTSGSDYHGILLLNQMPGNHDLGKNNCDEKIVDELRALSKNH